MMTDFDLYDVPTICRECDTEYIGKAFQPSDGKPRWAVCDVCAALQGAPKIAKSHDDLHPPRRTWEPD